MGKKDTITKEYLRNPKIFADAFNKYLYHGKQVIKPESLCELDTTEIVVPYGNDGAGVPEQKYRDILKLMMTDGNAAYCILGMESQSDIHYAMPVKNMVYDALQLADQVAETSKSHRRQNGHSENTEYKPSPDEFLGGFYKTDRLLPIITLVIFFSPKKWDGPLSLKEMYSCTDETLMKYVPDYRINLIAPGQMADEELDEFKSSLREVLIFNKYAADKEKLDETVKNDRNFRHLDRQTADVINVTTNSDLKYPAKKEMVDMCLALEQMKKESEMKGEIKGEIKGSIETYQDLGVTLQDTVQRIADKFSFSLQESELEVKKYWKN